MADLVLPASVARVPQTPPPLANLDKRAFLRVQIDDQPVRIYLSANRFNTAVEQRNTAMSHCDRRWKEVFRNIAMKGVNGVQVDVRLVPVSAENVLRASLSYDDQGLFRRVPGRPFRYAAVQDAMKRAKLTIDSIKYDPDTQEFRWVVSNSAALWHLCFCGVAVADPPTAVRIISNNDILWDERKKIRPRPELLKIARAPTSYPHLSAMVKWGKQQIDAAVAAPPPNMGGKTTIAAVGQASSTRPRIDFSFGIPIAISSTRVLPPATKVVDLDSVLPPAPDVDLDSVATDGAESDGTSTDDDSSADSDMSDCAESSTDPNTAASDSTTAKESHADHSADLSGDASENEEMRDDDEPDSAPSREDSDDGDTDGEDHDAPPRYERLSNVEDILGLQRSAAEVVRAQTAKLFKEGSYGTDKMNLTLSEDRYALHELEAQAYTLEQSVHLADEMLAGALRTVHLLKRKRAVLRELQAELGAQIALAAATDAIHMDPCLGKKYRELKRLRHSDAAENPIICALVE